MEEVCVSFCLVFLVLLGGKWEVCWVGFTGQLDILRGFASGVLCFRIPFWIGGKPL